MGRHYYTLNGPPPIEAGRIVLDCFLGANTVNQILSQFGGAGMFGRNFRGMLVHFTVVEARLNKGFGIDVEVPQGFTAPYGADYFFPAGVIYEDLIGGHDNMENRWVKVLHYGPTDRILMSTGAAEDNVPTLWNIPSSTGGTCMTHQLAEIEASRQLEGKVRIDGPLPATIDLRRDNPQIAATWLEDPYLNVTNYEGKGVAGGVPTPYQGKSLVAISRYGFATTPADCPSVATAGVRPGFVCPRPFAGR